MRRLLLVLPVLLLVGACGGETQPLVTFATGAASIVAKPAQFCDLKVTDCQKDDTAPVELAVPPGTPLTITVPADVASTPWIVVFAYRDATGQQVEGRGPLLGAGKPNEYALELPAPTDRLLGAQVQQFGALPTANEGTTEISFPIRATWVLTAAPA
ncbi:DUF2771 family protein [Pseudonocardia sp. TRM90224]|uniref:DUF2771 family protein n=1 Tax=Pseudonocardia sp. TRM90224 TaxID=2812678 RepID=UPI001E62FE4B|nr:DUF2771 family protein [Pseudonocardia sp. TRM90224]